MAAPTPNDALAYAKRFMGNMPIDDAATHYRILDDAHRKLWMAANWPWTVAALEVIQLVNDSQQSQLVTSPPNFLCLLHVTLTNGQEKNDLSISSMIPATSILKGRPTQVMWIPPTPDIGFGSTNPYLRFLPTPSGYTAPLPSILAIYKHTAPEINGANAGVSYATTSGVYDEWFWVYQEIVLLKAFQFTHDPRLGSITVAGQNVQYTGQYAVVEDAIRMMKAQEEKIFSTLGEPIA